MPTEKKQEKERERLFRIIEDLVLWRHHTVEGKLKPVKAGKLADFVVLSADPVAIDPKPINTIKVVETIKDGRTVWTRKQ